MSWPTFPYGAQYQAPVDKITSLAMSWKTVPIVHTQLWKDRRVDEKYTPARSSPAAAEATSTRLSCGCRTNNAGLAAWCVLHSEQVHSEESTGESTSSLSAAGRGAGEVPRIFAAAATASRDEMLLLHSELGVVCRVSQAFECVSVTDSEREYLYRRLFEGLKEQQHGVSRQSQLDELRHHELLGTADEDERGNEEKDRQFRAWVWREFNGWVESMYPDGSRSA
ncbi:hypothetical protein MAC_09540 [Metarhizium acridum CQMa 102]|uniref:Uncharacterized protein n=2 Tax=Metarhizium acridum TaxID=92637 RepID=E9EI42_METAQ|nr:uncharacterized protein MAC_09540 [Metarhizium acridum CQMa 102]EFY84413.1 hypothetical protein MAC_09540 [Metarhizium acridum CQMa 102]